MMLQGHFVDKVLGMEYRDMSSPIFYTWYFMRGMTAPIFFTVTGIVFVFLLLRKNVPYDHNPRVKAGLRRGIFLIFIGYVLKLGFFGLMIGKLYDHFWYVDVLHCIGIGLLSLIGLYMLSGWLRLPLPWVLGVAGMSVFLLDPLWDNVDYSHWLPALSNYFTQDYGSVFTPFPWIGYTFIGGVFGWHISRKPSWYRTWWLPLGLLLLGYVIQKFSAEGLMRLHFLTGWELPKAVAYNNYLIIPLGRVLMVISIFIGLEYLFKKFPPLLLKVGSETLTIYCAHYVVLYGTWYELNWVGRLAPLNPWATAIGALMFLSLFVGMIYYIEPIRAQWQKWVAGPALAARDRGWDKFRELFFSGITLIWKKPTPPASLSKGNPGTI